MFFVSRRTYERDLAAAKAEADRLRSERDDARAERAAFRTAAASAAEKFTDTSIVNECLTRDLTEARERLSEYGIRRTVPEVLEEHDVHRKALADALGNQKRHLNWEQLVAEVGRLREVTSEWMANYRAEKRRADRLQVRLDDACGLNDPAVDQGAAWQARRHDKPRTPKEASTS